MFRAPLPISRFQTRPPLESVLTTRILALTPT